MDSTARLYTTPQRYTALVYGIVSLTLFVASVSVMCWSLYNGLHGSLLHLHGGAALAMDVLLILQFAIGHTLLLSDRGRRFMTRLAPLGLGSVLSTTIFAGFASVQLLMTFLLWSSTDIVWWMPAGGIKIALSVLYVLSWIMLAKSMTDAGIDIQMGTLGWRSVWRGERPVYRPFTRTGMFRHSRQPIYASFTLILWTGPVWTPDHLVIAVLWSAYCVLAPMMKEKRYRQWYGAAFERYRQRVPYWFPAKVRSIKSPTMKPTDHDIAIVGAGPVGLLLAGLLGQKGLRVLIVDKRTEPLPNSQAIGITPPSLEILSQLGLDDEFVRRGVPIRDCHVHGQNGRLGCVSFREIPGAHRYILSLPQQQTLTLLEAKLATMPNVTLHRGIEITQIDQDAETVTLQGDGFSSTARWLIGCDGNKSRVRELIKMRSNGANYGCHFLMGDFIDHTDMKEEAHLWFTADGAVEAFPLPDGKRRWIVQTKQPVTDSKHGIISELVRKRSSLNLAIEDQLNQSPFSPRWMQAEQYHDGRVILCGDAAHLMSPIGGQGMNTGWADAEFLAEVLLAIEQRAQPALPLLEAYDRCRHRASNAAIQRAARGMWLGTRTGIVQSWLRDVFMSECLFKGPLSRRTGPYFAMLTIPYSTMKQVPAKVWEKAIS
jgi:2-polyprenyl-6-methoxyphenol hydroxylase-like FAD-dependent oxidoreductase/protein-S-isoprenylcysteine O-methyltransferase Ste14